MKRVTFRITATMDDEVDKNRAKELMHNALRNLPNDLMDPFVQVMQVDQMENKPNAR